MNITLVFCTIHGTIHFSLKRQDSAANGSSDLHTCWQFYSSLNTLRMIFLILIAPNTTMASIVMTVKYRLIEYVVFPQKGYIFMHDLAPCHNFKGTRTFLACNDLPVLKWRGNSPEINSIENFWNIMKEGICNQLPCLNEEIWKRVWEAWYRLAPNVLEELNNSIPK